jgi:hypothetical protein
MEIGALVGLMNCQERNREELIQSLKVTLKEAPDFILTFVPISFFFL